MVLIGINYKNTPLELREKFYFNEEEILELQQKNSLPKVIISTCNRTEIYFESLEKEEKKQLVERVIKELFVYKGLSAELLKNYFYIYYDEKAIIHLYKVATSINSMIIGETQILGQLKDAYHLASQKQKLSSYLNKVFQEAIRVGKKARAKTAIGQGETSLGTITVDTIKKFFPYKKLYFFIFGRGEVIKEVLKHLGKLQIEKIFITTRRNKPSYKNLFGLEKNVDKIEYVPITKKLDYIKLCDVIISASSSPKFLLNEKEYQGLSFYSFKLRLFIDLGVPRNIDPKITKVEDTLLYSLDDLKESLEKNYQKRINEINEVKKIIQEQFEELKKWEAKRLYLEIFSNVKNQITQLNRLNEKEYLLVALEKYKKKFPRNKKDLEKKINDLMLFLVKQNIAQVNFKIGDQVKLIK